MSGPPSPAFLAACRMLSQRRWSEALAAFDAVLATEPDYAPAHNNRGVALHNLRRDDEALAAYSAALKLAPADAGAWCNRGNALTSLRRFPEALAAFDAALAHDPSLRAGLDNRGALNLMTARYEAAAHDYAALLALAPDHPFARANLLLARRHLCDWRDHDALRDAIDADARAGRPACPPFAALALLDDPEAQARCASLWTQVYFPPGTPIVTAPPTAQECIRVAYLSGDFHEHATAHLAIEVFERHDRARFETIALSYGPDTGDAMRARLKNAFSEFIDVSELSDRAIAELMAARGVDIAIDLKGYTLEGRPGILAHRGAPVQVSFLGFPGTLGAPYVDYVIADPVIAPREGAASYSEKIVRLPLCYQPNSGRRADAAPTRAELGLPNDAFVLASFNNAFKIAPDMFAAWMRLLRATPGAVLWLYADEACAANLRAHAETAGVDPKRLVFAAHAAHAAHLARLACADLILDTYPYNGHTTASDALWAGVPVITLCGATFASRVAASLVAAAGAPDLATTSLADYEAIALHLARDMRALAEVKARLKPDAPLFDMARYTRDFEAALEAMLARAIAGLASAPIEL
ncbi:MAG: tetratricopeptide repeat protein [Alphaproteobacteria bacterium]